MSAAGTPLAHPDFNTAPADKKWRGDLAALRDALAAAAAAAPRWWCWRILESGTCVAMRAHPEVLEVMLSRRDRATRSAEQALWNHDVERCVRELRLDGWIRSPMRGEQHTGEAVIYTAHPTLLCRCGRRLSENGQLFGDPEAPRCDHCRLQEARGAASNNAVRKP